jgi:hypothetical protein
MVWTETPLERAQRLEDEALGRKCKKVGGEGKVDVEEDEEEKRERDRRIKEYNAHTRGPSLMEKYGKTKKVEEGEEDASKRGFDWQKDMAGGGTLGFKERSDFSRSRKLRSYQLHLKDHRPNNPTCNTISPPNEHSPPHLPSYKTSLLLPPLSLSTLLNPLLHLLPLLPLLLRR